MELETVQADVRKIHGELVGKLEELSSALPEDFEDRVASMEKAVLDATAKVDQAVVQISQIDQGIGGAFTALDHKLGAMFGEQGANEAALRAMSKQAGADIEGAMQGAMSNVDPSNPMVRQFYVWATKPIDEKWASKNPFQAMLVQGGKAWFAQNVLPMFNEGGGSDMVRLSSTSRNVEKIL